MKYVILILFAGLYPLTSISQVEVKHGPEMINEDKSSMNRLLGSDETGFYYYRIKGKGKGTSFYIEKINKIGLQMEFSKEFPKDEDKLTKIEDVHFTNGMIYIFIRGFDRETKTVTFYVQTMASDGTVSARRNRIVDIPAPITEIVRFEVILNPSRSKFLVKAFQKGLGVYDLKFKMDFILIDAEDLSEIWIKSLDDKRTSTGIVQEYYNYIGVNYSNAPMKGFHIDDLDNIFFSHVNFYKGDENKDRSLLFIFILKAADQEVTKTEFRFEGEYRLKDMQFTSTPAGEVVVGGFFNAMAGRGETEYVDAGTYILRLKISDGSLVSSEVKLFDNELLIRLESLKKSAGKLHYKMDKVLTIHSDIYFIGQQYNLNISATTNADGRMMIVDITYVYRDIVVVKVNAAGEIEWMKNSPMRNVIVLSYPHLFMQYSAIPTENGIFLLYNDHNENLALYQKETYDVKELKNMQGIRGAYFMHGLVPFNDEKVKYGAIFRNDDFSFAPILERNYTFLPPSRTEITIADEENNVFIFNEYGDKYRFSRIGLK